MNSISLHNIVDIRVLDINESDNGSVIWRTFEFEDSNGVTTQVTAFPDGTANKVQLDTNLDRDNIKILSKVMEIIDESL